MTILFQIFLSLVYYSLKKG